MEQNDWKKARNTVEMRNKHNDSSCNQRNVLFGKAGIKVGRGLEFTILWVSILFLSFTGIVSLIFTAYLPDYSYRIVFSTKQWWVVAIGAVVAIVLLGLLEYFDILRKIELKRLSQFLVAYSLVAGFAWIALAQVWPEWDSYDTFLAARALNDSSLRPDCAVPSDEKWAVCPYGAMERYPYQLPLMALFRFLNWAFGSGDYMAVEFLNVACVSISFWLIGRIAVDFFPDVKAAKVAMLLCVMFFPQLFYVTFAYGNTLSLPFVLTALLYQAKALRSNTIRYGIVSAASILVAVLVKSTMVYVLIAMILAWIIAFFKKADWRYIVCLIASLALFLCSGFIVGIIGRQFGYRTDLGLPKTVWLAMGMQEVNPDMPNNPGWYNGYPASWPDGYTVEEVKEDASLSIQKSIDSFVDDPMYAWEFFSKKFVSEWTEPTYESLLASNWSTGRSDRPAMNSRPMSAVLHSVYYGKLNTVVLTISDCLQFILLFGSACGLFLYRKQLTIRQLGMVMIPFGVAILYLFWEAQSQYVMPAYLVMIPFAGAGLARIAEMLSLLIKKNCLRNVNVRIGKSRV